MSFSAAEVTSKTKSKARTVIAKNHQIVINIDQSQKDQPITATLHSGSTDAPLKIGDHHFKLGGIYAGIAVGEDGKPDHPLALLSHKADKPMTWAEATKWAASFGDGSRLPTKREAALLYANLPDEFDKSDWHWTSTTYSGSTAWMQDFLSGGQGYSLKSSERLCRAVR